MQKTPVSPSRHAPGPPGRFLFGSLLDVRENPIEFYAEATRRYGDVVRFRYGRRKAWHLVNNPAHIEWILQKNVGNYPKGFFFNRRISLLCGNGLVTSEGDFWRRQRRLAQPAFHRQRLANLVGTMTDATDSMLGEWDDYARRDHAFDVTESMMRLALQVVGRSLFSTELGEHSERVYHAMSGVLAHIGFRMFNPFSAGEKVPTKRNRTFVRDRHTLDEVSRHIIEERRREGGDRGDLLSMLMLARDEETGEGMSDAQLLDEVRTLLFTGHETTAVALSWTFKLLAQNPHVRERLQSEVDEVLQNRTPTLEDLPRLTFTRQIFEETLRLYPPVWCIPRHCNQADEIGGYDIGADSTVVILPYLTHRHPDFWDNPEAFDPDRFSLERCENRAKFAYFPFGGGPRVCIGANFSMMEAQIILAMVTQKFQLDLVPDHPVSMSQSLTLRPRHGLKMTLTPR